MTTLEKAETKTAVEQLHTMAKVLGSMFYFPLTHENNRAILNVLKNDAELEHSEFSPFLKAVSIETNDDINQDFFLLFEGADTMKAPPWGSVYLDREQVVFGESMLKYRAFLRKNGVELNTGVREPEDQFGLMLFAICQLIELDAQEEISELLTQHLLPWAYRYLDLVSEHADTQSYRELALVTHNWCKALQASWEVKPLELQVYR